MNDGYLTAIIATVAAILLLTGWRRLLLGDVPRWKIVLFAAGCAIGSSSVWEGGEAAVQVNVAWLLLWGLAAAAVAVREQGSGYIAFTAALVIVLWFWCGRLYAANPAMVLYNPRWDGPLLAGTVAGCMTPRFRDQFALLACALPAAELLLCLSLSETILLGGAAWWDRFAATAVTARLAAALVHLAVLGCSRASAHLFPNEGGRAS